MMHDVVHNTSREGKREIVEKVMSFIRLHLEP